VSRLQRPPAVEAVGVTKRFGSTVALWDVTVRAGAGQVLCLLGPAGSGKSTVLRVVAGLETADHGRVQIAGQDVTHMPPRARRIGLVTGPEGVFGNLTVRENVGFGLRGRSWTPAERADLTERALADTDLSAHADKRQHQLTSAQAIRVVLARALAPQPSLLLVDDPVRLDAAVHDRLRDLIRRLHQSWSVTTLWATRDARTALAVADEIAVLRDGRLVQTAAPAVLYATPADAFVADLVDEVSWVPATGTADGRWRVLGRTVSADRPGRVGLVAEVALRPDQVVVERDGPAVVRQTTFQGSLTRLVVDDPGAGAVVADVLSRDVRGLGPGSPVRVGLHRDVDRVVVRGLSGGQPDRC
jgi:putative spermidine/putrescine transport system ATP-binding protein